MLDRIKLSPSTLNLYLACPRCFWLEVREKIRRPRGIFPSLPGGIDLALKRYYGFYREKGVLPPLLEGKVSGTLIKRLPKRFSYFDKETDAELNGMLDECLDFGDGTFAALDNKTRGSNPKELIKAYQVQLDVYTLLLEKNGYKTKNIAYLAYYFPKEANDEGFDFALEVKEVPTDPKQAQKLFIEAVNVLKMDKPPSSSKGCEYCKWYREKKSKLGSF